MKKIIDVSFPCGMQVDAQVNGMSIQTDQRERNGRHTSLS